MESVEAWEGEPWSVGSRLISEGLLVSHGGSVHLPYEEVSAVILTHSPLCLPLWSAHFLRWLLIRVHGELFTLMLFVGLLWNSSIHAETSGLFSRGLTFSRSQERSYLSVVIHVFHRVESGMFSSVFYGLVQVPSCIDRWSRFSML